MNGFDLYDFELALTIIAWAVVPLLVGLGIGLRLRSSHARDDRSHDPADWLGVGSDSFAGTGLRHDEETVR